MIVAYRFAGLGYPVSARRTISLLATCPVGNLRMFTTSLRCTYSSGVVRADNLRRIPDAGHELRLAAHTKWSFVRPVCRFTSACRIPLGCAEILPEAVKIITIKRFARRKHSRINLPGGTEFRRLFAVHVAENRRFQYLHTGEHDLADRSRRFLTMPQY